MGSMSSGDGIRRQKHLYPASPGKVPRYATPVMNTEPSCPLDSILLDFLSSRRAMAAQGASDSKLVGPAYPNISSLLNPDKSVHAHPLSKVFTDILGTFEDLSTLPEQTAVLYIMFLVMRVRTPPYIKIYKCQFTNLPQWQVSPTRENYERLPEWMRPTKLQLTIPHPAWPDHLPWPKMRDRIVEQFEDYPFHDFFIPFTTTLSLNWPYEPTDTLLTSPSSDELLINPVFERHLRNMENWTLGPSFTAAMPGLTGTVKIKVGEGQKEGSLASWSEG